ncbi:MAG: SprT family zinc-dependent metalloprotease, partial [Ideonella sp.]
MPRRAVADRPAPAIQLSLFDAPSAAAPVPASSPLHLPPGSPIDAADAAVPDALPAGLRVGPSSIRAGPSALEPGEFRHPQADRELRLNGHLVAYSLRRARRRSIGFVVGVEGLRVNAPRWVGIGDIENALREKADWILRKLVEQRERAGRLHAARVEWRHGISLPFLGQSIVVVLDPAARGAVLEPTAQTDSTAPHDAAITSSTAHRQLRLGLPHDATAQQIRDSVQSWLQRQARELFEARCQHYAAQLGVRYTRIGLSSAQTRWGSASASGAIRLNWRLIHFGLATVDYVIAHELAHLREMNHSPRFWDIVRSLMPDYEV